MQFRVSRNDQEYGPYTLEELQQYVSEGSILPTDYVFNGMDANKPISSGSTKGIDGFSIDFKYRQCSAPE